MKKLLLILLLLPLFGISQNYFRNVNRMPDTLILGENGASKIGIIKFNGNGSGSVRLRPLSAAGNATLYLLGNDGDSLITYAAARTLASGGTAALSSLTDANISSPSNLQILQFQTSDNKWHNHTITSGDIPDLSATYQTVANLSTNTSLGSSNTQYPSQNAVKTYVDNTAAAIVPKAASDYATTAALAANTYNNGAGTITMNSTGTVTIDGHVTALNENILIKDEGTTSHNGIYTVTTAGAVGVAGIFTRRTDFDAASEVVVGASTFVVNGSANAGKVFTQNAVVSTLGTDPITFVQTGGSSGVAWGAITGTVTDQTDLTTYLTSNYLQKSNNLSDVVSASTSRTNLGATTVGSNLFTLTNPSAVRFIRINADNTISVRTAAEMLSDIGAQASGSYAASGANTDITSVLLNQTGLKVKGGDANSLTFKPNETYSTPRILNFITNDADRTINLSGNITTANSFTTAGNFALTLTTTASTNVTLPTTGTLATLAGSEALTNKDLTGVGNTFPTFNQNTTGSAATLTTTRTLWGQNFNGSANVTGDMSSVGSITASKAGTVLDITNSTNATTNQIGKYSGTNSTRANNDLIYDSYFMANSTGTQKEFVRVNYKAPVVTNTSEDGSLIVSLMSAGTLTDKLLLTKTALSPNADNGLDLGTTTLAWGNIHLNTGATINVENGNAVITHSSGIFTVSTGDWRITTAGTNSASAVTVGGTQTLTAKTLTSPVINGATSSGSTSLDFSGSTGTFKTSTGTNTLGGATDVAAAFREKVVTVSDGAGAVIDASTGNIFDWTAAADRTAGTTTNPTNGQKIIIRFKASGGARTLTLPTAATGDFAFGSDITGLTQTVSGKTDCIGCVYSTDLNRWMVVAYVKGF